MVYSKMPAEAAGGENRASRRPKLLFDKIVGLEGDIS
jgi:hypothetical protein